MFALDVEGALIERVWPADRVVLGLRVCKRIRTVLLSEAPHVSLTRSHYSPRPHDSSDRPQIDFARCFKQFRNMVQAHVCLHGCSSLTEELGSGLERAKQSGGLHCLATLDIGSMFPRAPDSRLLRSLEACVNLTHLNLSSWKIGRDIHHCCTALQNCSHLVHLNLSNTSLSGDSDVAIANSVSPLTGLAFLSLAHNALSGQLIFESCSALTGLDLSGNMPRAADRKILSNPRVLVCTALRSLSLAQTNTSVAEASILAGILRQCRLLETLDVRNNDLQDDGAAAVLEAIGDACPELSVLNLENNRIRGGRAFGIAADTASGLHLVGRCGGLRDVEIGRNPLTLSSIATFLSTGGLRRLGLARAGLGGESVIRCGFEIWADVEECELGGNQIGAAGATQLGAALQRGGRLRVLGLERNDVRAEGLERLSEGLKECTRLEGLDVAMNGVGAAGAAALCGELGRLNRLRHLNLAGNDLGDAGVEVVAGAVAVGLPGLQGLKLGANGCGAAGATALASALRALSGLVHLSIDQNRVTVDGAEAIGAALRGRRSLTALDMRSCSLADGGCAAVLEGVRGCRALRRVDLEGNAVSRSEGARAIAAIDSLPDYVRVSPQIRATR